ncbi:MAG: esterase family protein [Acidobacteria bacterium]|nr:esterase family protein [Acidobacteriota bacterium]
MPIAVYGHYGAALLLYPTAAADCEEYERFGLIEAIAGHIDSGRVKVFSINSINRESWMNERLAPAERAWRQVCYDRYVAQEVAPFIASHCRTPGIDIAASGASFGAFHAANTLFKHSNRFRTLIAMSGSYDIRPYCDGYYDDNCYFNNPVDYLSRLEDPWILGQLRQCRIHILSGQGAWEAPNRSRELSAILNRKGVPHNLDLWGHDVDHDWPWWRKMLNVYIPRLF